MYARKNVQNIIAYLGVFLFGFIFLNGPVNAQNVRQRDLEIMEGILDKLIFESRLRVGWSKGTKGTYLEGYGIIFNVPYSSHGVRAITIGSTGESKDKKSVRVTVPGLHVQDEDETRSFEEIVAALKKEITTFFVDYAGAIEGLKPSDRITVVVEFNGTSNLGFIYSDDATPQAKQLFATTEMEKIDAARRNRISRSAFEKEIIFSQETGKGEGYRDLNILEDIFDSVIYEKSGRYRYFGSGNTRGMYFPGFGAVFMTNSDLWIGETFIKGLSVAKSFEAFVEVKPDRKPDDREPGLKLKELKDEIIDILARYGGSLRTVPETECVLVSLDLEYHFGKELPSRLYIKARMGDIRQFTRGQITMQNFKNRVKVREY